MADYARGERLKELRDATHLSQEEAAHEIGVTSKTVRGWEKGRPIKWDNALAAAEFYGVDPESIVSREPNGKPRLPLEEILQEVERMRGQLGDLAAVIAEQIGDAAQAEHTQAQPQRPSKRGKRTAAGSDN